MKATKFACGVLFLVLLVGLLPLLAACGGGDETATTAAPTTTAGQATTTTAGQATTTTGAAPDTTATTAAAGPAQTYTIGLIHSMSGVMAAAFNAVTEAMPLVEQVLNSRGGFTVNGQQYNIKLVVEDDMSTTDGAIAAAKKLIGAGVKQIIAPQFIPNNAAIAPICEQNKILRVVSIGPNLTEYAAGTSKYCFAAISTAVGAQATLDKTFELYPGIKKIAVVALDDPGIQDIVGRAKEDFLSAGHGDHPGRAVPGGCSGLLPADHEGTRDQARRHRGRGRRAAVCQGPPRVHAADGLHRPAADVGRLG